MMHQRINIALWAAVLRDYPGQPMPEHACTCGHEFRTAADLDAHLTRVRY